MRSKNKDLSVHPPGLVGSSLHGVQAKARLAAQKSVEPEPEMMGNLEEGKKKRPPTPLPVARWMPFTQQQRLDWQKAYLTRLSQADREMAQTFDLMQECAALLRERQGEQRLATWLKQVGAQGVCELPRFAPGLQKDSDAVKAGLTLSWSNDYVA